MGAQAASKPVLSTNAKGECPAKGAKQIKYKSVSLPGGVGLATLSKVLPHVNYLESGVGGKPTIQLTGINVQLVSGAGSTSAINGLGNLIIGYDETPGTQTGSHNLIFGEEQTFTSYGGVLTGRHNTISAPFASVTGGEWNTASGWASSISGGVENTASGESPSSVSGGRLNTANGRAASVSGGTLNEANGEANAISGGYQNQTTGGRFASRQRRRCQQGQRRTGLGDWRRRK